MDCVAHQAPLSMEFSRQILEWAAISSSRGSSLPGDKTHFPCGSCIGRQILYYWATWGAYICYSILWKSGWDWVDLRWSWARELRNVSLLFKSRDTLTLESWGKVNNEPVSLARKFNAVDAGRSSRTSSWLQLLWIVSDGNRLWIRFTSNSQVLVSDFSTLQNRGKKNETSKGTMSSAALCEHGAMREREQER